MIYFQTKSDFLDTFLPSGSLWKTQQTYLEKLDINDVASIFASKDARTFSFHFEFHSISSPFQSLNCYAMANINHIYIINRQNNIVDPKPFVYGCGSA